MGSTLFSRYKSKGSETIIMDSINRIDLCITCCYDLYHVDTEKGSINRQIRTLY